MNLKFPCIEMPCVGAKCTCSGEPATVEEKRLCAPPLCIHPTPPLKLTQPSFARTETDRLLNEFYQMVLEVLEFFRKLKSHLEVLTITPQVFHRPTNQPNYVLTKN